MRRANIFRILVGVVLIRLSAQVGRVEERNPTNEVEEAIKQRAIDSFQVLRADSFVFTMRALFAFSQGFKYSMVIKKEAKC